MPASDGNDEVCIREAEVRGTITGALIAGETSAAAARLGAALANHHPGAPLSGFASEMERALRGGRFELPPILSDRAVALALRTAMMAAWTRGYLSGLGQAGARLAGLAADGREMLRDCETLARGAALDDHDAAGDEAAYAELLDYLRFTAEYFHRALA